MLVVGEMPRQHRPVSGRIHTATVLRALADAEGGRLHYSMIQMKLTLAVGKPVSALNILLHDLEEERLILKLPAKAGYEITDNGRKALADSRPPIRHEFHSKRGGGGWVEWRNRSYTLRLAHGPIPATSVWLIPVGTFVGRIPSTQPTESSGILR